MIRKTKHLSILLIGLIQASILCGSAAHAMKEECCKEMRKPASKSNNKDVAESDSKWVRSRVSHFWLSRPVMEQQYFSAIPQGAPANSKRFVDFVGWINYDSHMANYAPVFLDGKIHFLNVDPDHTGYGPFAYDFARFTFMVDVVTGDAKYQRLHRIYTAGLRRGITGFNNTGDLRQFILTSHTNGTINMPESLRPVFDWTRADFENAANDYAKGKYKEKKGNPATLVDKELNDMTGRERSAIATAMKNVIGADSILEIKERIAEENVEDGDAEPRRYWVLAQKANGQMRIYELKEILQTDVEDFERHSVKNGQVAGANALQRFLRTKEVFWLQKDNSSDYGHVRYGNADYSYRVKFGSIIDIPYSANKSSEVQEIDAIADIDMLYKGLIHGSQRGASEYLDMLNKYPEAFDQEVKRIVDEYYKDVQKDKGQG